MWKEFRAFIARGNVIDLAVGVVIGAAFNAIVNSLVNDIVMPPIGLLLAGVNFSDLFFALDGKAYASLQAAQQASAPIWAWGRFIQTIINFLIVATAMFFLVKVVSQLYRKPASPAPPSEPSEEVKLLSEIRNLLKAQR
jgi:large conductance mechanosensitive channel